MILKEIALQEIDFQNETFRISDTLDSETLRESLRSIGQLNPVALSDGDSKYLIVCGFRRLCALDALGKDRALAWILSGQDRTPGRCFEFALWDNLAHRPLSPLEKARIVFKLVNAFGVSPQTVVQVYLPILGLAPHPGILQSCLSIYGAHPELQRCLIEGRLTQSSIEVLSKKPLHVQEWFVQLMNRIRLSTSLQKKTLNLLEELAAISGAEFGEPLCTPEARQTMDDPRLSFFQKGEKLNELLYQMRFPRLSRAVDKFSADRKLLGLPGSIRISSDPFFETGDLRVEFDASSPKQFRGLAEALYSASRSPLLEELYNVG
jgi:uncharacterized ParB-like nuclease family protein